jgi:hypothetical protein
VPEKDIKEIGSVLTVLGVKVVHGTAEFGNIAPPLPASPDWSPVAAYGVHHHEAKASATLNKSRIVHGQRKVWLPKASRLRGIAYDCFAF